MSLSVIILAAGSGSRMNSPVPKPLQTIAGKSLLSHIIDAALALNPKECFVVYPPAHEKAFRLSVSSPDIYWQPQSEQLGTGHAVQRALPHVEGKNTLVLFADVPLIALNTLEQLVKTGKNDLAILTHQHSNPFSLGRIIRDIDQSISAIVEERDASEEEKAISEIFTGILTAPTQLLKNLFPRLSRNNNQGQFYLTELVALAPRTLSVECTSSIEISGVNTQQQLTALDRQYQRALAEDLMMNGVRIMDPDRIDIRGELIAEPGVTIDINCVLSGKVVLKSGAYIGPGCCLEDCVVGENTNVQAHSVIRHSQCGANVQIGPFAHLRPGSHIHSHAKVGNFVEVKQSTLGEHSKISHLSYLGDAIVGDRVNIGASTITCNYDGQYKHSTIIESGAFIGSHTSLVAPVRIGAQATIGAGSTITKDAPAGQLTLSRLEQQTVLNWAKNKEIYSEKATEE